MSELIDRQDVIDRLKKAEDVFRQNGAKLEANGIHYALELVESDIEIPTVEAYPFEQVQELVKLNFQFAEEIENLKRLTVEERARGNMNCMDEDAKQASIPYAYNAPKYDQTCGYPDIIRGEK